VEKEPQQYAQKNHYIYFSVTSPSASNLIASLTAVVVPTTVTIPTEVSKWKKLSPNLFFTQTWNGAKPPKFNLGVKIESSFGFNYNQPYNLGLQIVYSNIPGAVAISQNFVITSCDPICNAPCGDNCDISANIGYIAGNLPAIKVIPNNCVCDQINGDSPEVFRTCPWHKVVLSKIQQIKPNGKVASTVSTFPYLQWGDQFTNIEGEDVNQLTGYIKVGSQKVGTQLTVSITNQVITTCIQIGSTCAGNWPSLGNDNLTVTYQVVTKEAFVIYDTDNLDSFLKKIITSSNSNGFLSQALINHCPVSNNNFPIWVVLESRFPFTYTVHFNAANQNTDGTYGHCSTIELQGGQTFFDTTDSSLVEDTQNGVETLCASLFLIMVAFLF